MSRPGSPPGVSGSVCATDCPGLVVDRWRCVVRGRVVVTAQAESRVAPSSQPGGLGEGHWLSSPRWEALLWESVSVLDSQTPRSFVRSFVHS